MNTDVAALVDKMALTIPTLDELAEHAADPDTRDLYRELASLWTDVAAVLSRIGRSDAQLLAKTEETTALVFGNVDTVAEVLTRRMTDAERSQLAAALLDGINEANYD